MDCEKKGTTTTTTTTAAAAGATTRDKPGLFSILETDFTPHTTAHPTQTLFAYYFFVTTHFISINYHNIISHVLVG